eukprot:IDg21044t1
MKGLAQIVNSRFPNREYYFQGFSRSDMSCDGGRGAKERKRACWETDLPTGENTPDAAPTISFSVVAKYQADKKLETCGKQLLS